MSIDPWRDEIADGLLGSSIVGFQTQSHCNHFLETEDASLEARIDRADNAVIRQGWRTLVRPYLTPSSGRCAGPTRCPMPRLAARRRRGPRRAHQCALRLDDLRPDDLPPRTP